MRRAGSLLASSPRHEAVRRALGSWGATTSQAQPLTRPLLDEAALRPCTTAQGLLPGSAQAAAPISTSAAAAAAGGGGGGPGAHHLGPSVKILLESSGLDVAAIRGTGPHGIVTKGDVLLALKTSGGARAAATTPAAAAPPAQPRAAAAAPAPPPPPVQSPAAPAAAAAAARAPPPPPPATPASLGAGIAAGSASWLPPSEQIPTSQLRRIIATRLLESKLGSPHFYAEAEAVIDETLAVRKRLKETLGLSVSVNDFVIKAAAAALHQVPEANVFWDVKTQSVQRQSSIDISVAVATDKGLYTPIVKGANAKTLTQISADVKELAGKARAGKLLPEEFQGGCFTISNLGMFPIDRFSAIINPPQPCILAVGKGEKVARWLSPPSSPEDVPQVVTKMEVTLSADARAIDPPVAGRFLTAICANLKDPVRLIV